MPEDELNNDNTDAKFTDQTSHHVTPKWVHLNLTAYFCKMVVNSRT